MLIRLLSFNILTTNYAIGQTSVIQCVISAPGGTTGPKARDYKKQIGMYTSNSNDDAQSELWDQVQMQSCI
jgi:hypothetical protein